MSVLKEVLRGVKIGLITSGIIVSLGYGSFYGWQKYSNNPLELPFERLFVNNSNFFSTVVNKDEQRGLEEIVNLVETSNLEEAWSYLPEEEKWVELGKYSAPEYVVFYKPKLLSAIEDNDSVIFYHFHPAALNQLEHLLEIGEITEKDLPEGMITPNLVTIIDEMNASPSSQDLTMMTTSQKIADILNPDVKLDYKVVSPLGTSEYHLTEKGKEFFKGMSNQDVYNFMYVSDINATAKVNYLFSWLETSRDRIEEYHNQITKDGYFEVKFIPHKIKF